MKNRQQKVRIQEIWQETFSNLEPEDEAMRAARVRSLCPCEYPWIVPLWNIIFAACDDPSPLVRVEALHVIEDAHTYGFSTSGGMARLYRAKRDSAPEVRRFVNDVLKQRPKLQQRRNRVRDRIRREVISRCKSTVE